jgi:hypothetical protein
MQKIRILSDSRGEGLKDALKESGNFTDCDVLVTSEKGLTYANILQTLRHQISVSPRQEGSGRPIAVVVAGICSLTIRTKATARSPARITYRSCPTKLEQIRNTLTRLADLADEKNLDLVIVTIPPASIEKYNDFQLSKFRPRRGKTTIPNQLSPEATLTQQTHLEADINSLNEFISNLCTARHYTSLNWHHHLERRSTKKGKWRPNTFRYAKLYDGVHPIKELRKKWFDRIVNICNSKKNQDPSTADSQSEEETWDHKRKVKL